MAATLRLGKSHYEALLPQLEEMGWSSGDAHQVLLNPSYSLICFHSMLFAEYTHLSAHRLYRPQVLATSPRQSIGAVQPAFYSFASFYFIFIFKFSISSFSGSWR